MSLNVPYTIDLVTAANREDLRIDWWEECLSPDDFDGFQQLKRAHPTTRFTTGEHEYSRYGFRKLIEGRNLDIIQPDVMWLGKKTSIRCTQSCGLIFFQRWHDRIIKGGRYGIGI
jgi:L-rhamnonate dehydratase